MGRLVDTSIDTPFFEGVLLAGGRSPYKAATHTHMDVLLFQRPPVGSSRCVHEFLQGHHLVDGTGLPGNWITDSPTSP